MPYGDVIRAFAEPDPSRGYLARITPYAYVAAELLGAKLNILAVYKSKATNSTTYHSYFVVRKDRLQDDATWKPESGEPSLEDIAPYLRRASKTNPAAKFIYHDRFSTSSYFMPSLYFKEHDVFAMSQSLNPHLIPIEVERLASTSSSDLVQQIVDGKADLVAVWDGTKKKFDKNPDLLFIQIPTAVPNDFLVASGISERTQRLIVDAIKADPAAGRLCTDLPLPPARRRPQEPPSRRGRRVTTSRTTPDRRTTSTAWYAWDSNDSDVTDAATRSACRSCGRMRASGRPRWW